MPVPRLSELKQILLIMMNGVLEDINNDNLTYKEFENDSTKLLETTVEYLTLILVKLDYYMHK